MTAEVYAAARALPSSPSTRLVVDAGGSTLRLVECDLDGTRLAHEKYAQPEETFASMDEGIAAFLSKIGRRPAIGVVGAAGPIEHARRVSLTNLPEWPVFDVAEASSNVGVALHLFNDLVVAAASIPALGDADLDVIRAGDEEVDGPALVVNLGTGLNDALALPSSFGPMRFIAGESGHIPFAPRDETELELLRWAWRRGDGLISFEDLISGGAGFRLVFDFVTQHLSVPALPETVDALRVGAPHGPTVSAAALDRDDPAATRALQLAGNAMGTYLGLRAMSTVSSGGMYLVGSVATNAREMAFFVQHSAMLDRFAQAGPISDIVRRIPISRVVHSDVGLLGAAEIARHLEA